MKAISNILLIILYIILCVQRIKNKAGHFSARSLLSLSRSLSPLALPFSPSAFSARSLLALSLRFVRLAKLAYLSARERALGARLAARVFTHPLPLPSAKGQLDIPLLQPPPLRTMRLFVCLCPTRSSGWAGVVYGLWLWGPDFFLSFF